MKIPEERKRLLGEAAFEYNYRAATQIDKDLDLKPGSAFSTKLVNKALELACRAQAASSDYHKLWKKMDWTLTGYVTPEDANPRGNPKDRNRNIVVPMTFEMRELFKSAAKGTFIQDPIFKYRPYPGAKSLMNAAVMEYLIQAQCRWFGLGKHAMTMWSDAFTYGIATGSPEWRQKRGRRPVNHKITKMAIDMARTLGNDVPRDAVGKVIRDLEEQVLYEGTELVPWDVYNTMWDPNTNPNNFQRGEFIGNIYRLNATDLLRVERNDEDRRFNGQYVRMLAEKGQGESRFNKRIDSGRADRTRTELSTQGIAPNDHTSPADFLYFELDIIPKEWECGDETWPVKYMLEVACDSVVTAFGPLNVMDDEYRAVMAAPNTDGHSVLPVSHLFVTFGIQEFIDHMARCTQALATKNVNGGWTVFNHNVLNWDDMNNPEPSKLIRYANPHVTPEQAKVALQQFNVPDMRESHMRHMAEMMELARSGNGLKDQMPDLPERPTQLGVRAATAPGASRVEMIMWMLGEQMMTPLGWKMAQNQVQYGKLPAQFELAGRLMDRVADEISADPAAIAEAMELFDDNGMADPLAMSLDFEMEPYTGASANSDDLQSMGQFLMAGMNSPEVLAEISQGSNWAGLARAFARKTGFGSVAEYKRAGGQMPQMAVAPDEELQKQIQAGNRVPLEQV